MDSRLVTIDLVEELADLRVGVKEVNMILTQDFLQRNFCLLSSPDDIVTVLLLVLELVKVALDDAMSQLLQLLNLLHEATIFWILLPRSDCCLILDFLFIGNCIVQLLKLFLELGDFVAGHLLGCLDVKLGLVLVHIGCGGHVDTGDVAVLPVLCLARFRQICLARNHWQLKLRVLLLLAHQLADVEAEL